MAGGAATCHDSTSIGISWGVSRISRELADGAMPLVWAANKQRGNPPQDPCSRTSARKNPLRLELTRECFRVSPSPGDIRSQNRLEKSGRDFFRPVNPAHYCRRFHRYPHYLLKVFDIAECEDTTSSIGKPLAKNLISADREFPSVEGDPFEVLGGIDSYPPRGLLKGGVAVLDSVRPWYRESDGPGRRNLEKVKTD